MQSVIPQAYRADCAERYESIKTECIFTDKKLIDIGCANGYFIARFLDDGGTSAVGIEPDEQYKADFIVRNIEDVNEDFDVCFYLDLHFHDGIDYLPWIKNHVKTLFVSPSGVGNNERLEEDLIKNFGNFKFISRSGYANRNIYRVCL